MNGSRRLVSGVLVLAAALGAHAGVAAAVSIDPASFSSREIHHSPQRPGYTAWTGAWIGADDSLVTAFTQVTGPVASPPDRDFSDLAGQVKYLRSTDGGATFAEFQSDFIGTPAGARADPHAFTPQATTGLPNGALIRRVNGEDLKGLAGAGPATAYLQILPPRTAQNPRPRWGRPIYLADPDRWTYQVSRVQALRDGTLVATGQIWAVPAGGREPGEPYGSRANPFPQPLMRVSRNRGRTWGNALRRAPRREPYLFPNEWDLAELPNGNLLAVFRSRRLTGVGRSPTTDVTQVRNQALLVRNRRRGGRGPTWTLRRVRPAPFPHSGHPELLATREGVVLHIAAELGEEGTSVIHSTADGGRSWSALPTPPVGKNGIYYPSSVQTRDGTIHVFGHVGADDAYGARDQSITLEQFRLRP